MDFNHVKKSDIIQIMTRLENTMIQRFRGFMKNAIFKEFTRMKTSTNAKLNRIHITTDGFYSHLWLYDNFSIYVYVSLSV